GSDEYNTGGVTKIVSNKVFIYYTGDHSELEEQISGAITEIILNEMLYGVDLRENVTNSTLLTLPEWYRNGLISYISENWSVDMENRVKDGILSGEFIKFNQLRNEEATYAGHSFWRFIAETYGSSVVSNVIYLTRINKNPNTAFLYVLGMPLKDLSEQWRVFYCDKYYETFPDQSLPETATIGKKPRERTKYYQVRQNPKANYIAYVTNQMGRYKIWLHHLETGRNKKIHKDGHRLEQITDYSYPVLAWHPSGRILTFFVEDEGGIRLYYYTLATGEMDYQNFLYFDKILDYGFSHDGLKLVLSAVLDGKTDIFVHTIASGTNEQITNDLADDFHPRFIDGSKRVIFSSNRASDTIVAGQEKIPLQETHDLFIYNYSSKSKILRNITDQPFDHNLQPYQTDHNEFVYLSDKNGIMNRYVAEFDSTISFVDTAIHYRYLTETYPVTNYKRNIEEHNYVKERETVSELLFYDDRYRLYESTFNKLPVSDEIENTGYRETLTRERKDSDSLKNLQKEVIPVSQIRDNKIILAEDTIEIDESKEIDINNYVFEEEKISYYNQLLRDENIAIQIDTNMRRDPKGRLYETSFYTNFLASKVDFSFLNSSYQAYTGGAVYYNPGFNLFFKLGTNDLFEDYKITGGVRFAGDFDSNEYLLSFENLKKRLDKQFIFHRQIFKNNTTDGFYILKTHTHEVLYVLSYPFDQVKSFKGTVSFRHDRTVFLSLDYNSLDENNITRPWAGLKGEYIFDNTRSLGINLLWGTRYKLFAEYYRQITDRNYELYVLGADFRHYIPIHRNLTWANRFAASTSFGRSPLVYYLGSLDNWINLFPNRVQTFDNSVPVDQEKNYAYQTLATNMRGFTQNIRNGNNFALVNTEIRFPVFSYLMNRPLSSSFLNNFQVVGFTDVGSAWTGLTPFSGENAYDSEIIENGPLTITLDSKRYPIVAGYGFGFRTQLLGYFVRLDWAWGIENGIILPRILYFSLNLDF
ncbi:MAG: hypothetical protein ACOCXD_02565, partial [Bacteroidota bacterium]